MIHLYIETLPIPKGRPRFTRSGHSYTPKRTKDYEKLIKTVAQDNVSKGDCFTTPVQVNANFYFQVPKSYNQSKKDDCFNGVVLPKADLDNLLKSLLDALNGICFTDDTLVQKIRASKRYADKNFIEVEIKKCPSF